MKPTAVLVAFASLASAATAAQTPVGSVLVSGEPVAVDFVVPDTPPEMARIAWNAPQGPTRLGHIVWAPTDDTPDASRQHALVALGEPNTLFASWTSRGPQRVSATDLDGDGVEELIRDALGPRPCGVPVWRTPEVYNATSGNFEPVAITPSTPSTAVEATPADWMAAPHTASRSFDDALGFAPSAALHDGDATTQWSALHGGAWLALDAPATGHVQALHLAGSDAEEVVVIVRTSEAEFTTTITAEPHEVALPADARCVVITSADPAFTGFSEARLMLVEDALAPAERAMELWVPAVTAACEAEEHLTAHRAAADAALHENARVTLANSDDPCVLDALVTGLAAAFPDQQTRAQHVATLLTSPLAEITRETLLGAVSDAAAAQPLVDALTATESYDAALADALMRLPNGAGDLQLTTLAQRALADPETWGDTMLALAPRGTIALGPVWQAADDISQQRAALHWVANAASVSWSPDALTAFDEALESDDGSVARVAIHIAGRHHHPNGSEPLWAIATSDPIGHLRAAAVEALDALGALDEGAIHTLRSDDAPSVRLATAQSDAAATYLLADLSRIDALLSDAWPDVAKAWIATAVREDHPLLDAALADALQGTSVVLVASALQRWSSRGTTVLDPVVALGRQYGLDPRTLPWTLLLTPLSDEGCTLGWLDALSLDTLPDDARTQINTMRATLCAGD